MSGGLRLYAIPYSTNVERVGLVLGHKGLTAEVVMCEPADRSPIRDASGQDLVPVLDDDGFSVADSTRIMEHLERRFPDPPLYPADPARRAEVEVFVDWFNRVWKVPPNAIEAELGGGDPDHVRVAALEQELRSTLDVFEALLAGRDYLLGDDLTIADVAAYPFIKYATDRTPGDDYPIHEEMRRLLSVEGRPRLAAWIERVGALARA